MMYERDVSWKEMGKDEQGRGRKGERGRTNEDDERDDEGRGRDRDETVQRPSYPYLVVVGQTKRKENPIRHILVQGPENSDVCIPTHDSL